ncbi:hypothetical protein [Nocardia sp. NPDC052566]|uniref:hypothetical protein n=1 Tax=Nocardia sp. NPDC052566 TaxID=3364330 RepID=UPI0037C83676
MHDLQHTAGIGAAGRELVGSSEDFALFRRVMSMHWQRIGAISHVLGVTGAERSVLWQRGGEHWSDTVTGAIRATEPQRLRNAFGVIARADFTAAAIPMLVLQAAGITAHDVAEQMPESPDAMIALVTITLAQHSHGNTIAAITTSDVGADINQAITAAGLTTIPDIDEQPILADPPIGPAVRSSEFGREP